MRITGKVPPLRKVDIHGQHLSPSASTPRSMHDTNAPTSRAANAFTSRPCHSPHFSMHQGPRNGARWRGASDLFVSLVGVDGSGPTSALRYNEL